MINRYSVVYWHPDKFGPDGTGHVVRSYKRLGNAIHASERMATSNPKCAYTRNGRHPRAFYEVVDRKHGSKQSLGPSLFTAEGLRVPSVGELGYW